MLKNNLKSLPFVRILIGISTLCALCYVGLIAIVMSYAAMHVEFAQQVRSDEAAVALLERSYLSAVSDITATDFKAIGYESPVAKRYVVGSPETALINR